MKKSRILMAVSALVLTAGAFVAGKASNKFAAAKAYYKNGSNTCVAIDNATAAAGTRFTTAGLTQAQIRTNAGSTTLLYSNSTCTNAAYFLY